MDDLFTKSGADFSNDRNYRYALWRIWDENKPLVMFIGLNPSTANETEPDPTIKSVTRIAKHNGFGGFYMMNCFAWVTSDPKLLQHNAMSDEWNNNMLTVIAGKCNGKVVFAWGGFKVVKDTGRDRELIEMFPNALCIGVNQDGSPKHPLFQKGTSVLVKFAEATPEPSETDYPKNENDQDNDFDDDDSDEGLFSDDDDDDFENAMDECGQIQGGGCVLAGTEYCDWECPFSHELYHSQQRDANGRFTKSE